MRFFFDRNLPKHWMHMEMHEKAWKFLKVWPEIVSHANVASPSIFQVAGGKSLKVELIARTKQ